MFNFREFRKCIGSLLSVFIVLLLFGCTVQVSSIEISDDNVSIAVGKGLSLVAVIQPDNASDKSIVWSTSDPTIATVDEYGVVTAVGVGSATITARSSNGKSSSCIVTVLQPVESVSFSVDSILLEIGSTHSLTPIVYPQNASNVAISWSSSNSSIAIVNSYGLVTAVGEGKATITATSSNGKKASCEVIVHYGVGDYSISEGEINDSMTSAKLINVNGTTISGSNFDAYDVDYFKVYLTAGQTLYCIIAPHYSIDVPWYAVGLWNSSDVAVAASVQDSGGKTRSLTYTVPKTGYYYILVFYHPDSPYSDGDSYSAFVYWD